MVKLFAKNFENEIKELNIDVNVILNLGMFVDQLIKANIRSHRQRNQRDSGFDSLLGMSIANSFGDRSRGDDTNSSITGESIQSGCSGSTGGRQTSSVSDSSYFAKSSTQYGKRNVSNYR
ncbi:unnamed protein product [Ambrosiozyma monospora]|uniref:Unnamed protein product n=1 Tax=Ambrosiozyma monospora TaxID=43982 RepID=A0ACB5SVD0_AMBMO|nr:unnamed protein product [Ambrosiozyma monospora]